MHNGSGWHSHRVLVKSLWLSAFLITSIVSAGLVSTGVVQAQLGPCGTGGTFYSSQGTDSCLYGGRGATYTFVVPVGLSDVAVVATGGAGGEGWDVAWSPPAGGYGAVVSNAALPVVAGATLYVYVGQDGSPGGYGVSSTPSAAGNYGQGGAGGAAGGSAGGSVYAGGSCVPGTSCAEAGAGGGGGGSSGLSLQPLSSANLTGDPGTDPRLLVAGGGGGGGGGGELSDNGSGFSVTYAGGLGGNAGTSGPGSGPGGSGGTSAAATSGLPGGIGGPAGGNGTAGTGGATIDGGPANWVESGGGGGGGGWFGGGGGDSNDEGAGGGGGGSSYGGQGGPVTVATADPGTEPSVVISWAASAIAPPSTTTSRATTTTTIAPSPRAVIASPLAKASKGYVTAELSCERAACSGSAEITEQLPVKQHKADSTTDYETVVLAKASFRIGSGKSAIIKLKETKAGKALFADVNGSHQVRRRIVVSVRGGSGVAGTLTIT